MWENTPAGGEASFLDTLWLAFNEVSSCHQRPLQLQATAGCVERQVLTCSQAIQLKDCDVYSYKSEGDADPFGELSA